MNKKLYVGNLPWSVDDHILRRFFEGYVEVVMATVIMDRETGRSRGFGFVEIKTDEQAEEAIRILNGKYIEGRQIMIREAKPEGTKPPNHAAYISLVSEFVQKSEIGEETFFNHEFKKFSLVREN